MSIQLQGNLSLGPDDQTTPDVTDYSSAITSITINRERSEVTIPATLATGQETSKGGVISESVTLSFISTTAAADVWAELWDAMDTTDGILYFEGNLNSGATGVDNPQFSGRFVVTSLETGGDVGSLRLQTQTYPCSEAVAKATS